MLLQYLGIDYVRIYNDTTPGRAFRRVKGEINIRLHNLVRKGIV